jgi:lysine biosynthesis protein LysW
MNYAECPNCGAEVKVGAKPKIGQRVTCEACNTELEVAWLDPIELDWPFEDDEDIEYEYDADDEDYDY